MAEIVPNAVSISEEGYYQMDYSKLIPIMIQSIKDQESRIQELEAALFLQN